MNVLKALEGVFKGSELGELLVFQVPEIIVGIIGGRLNAHQQPVFLHIIVRKVFKPVGVFTLVQAPGLLFLQVQLVQEGKLPLRGISAADQEGVMFLKA